MPFKERFTGEKDITNLLEKDEWRMEVLAAAAKTALSDWWIGAGFLRNAVWDAMEGNVSLPTRDVDLVYFNPNDVRPETDWGYDEKLKAEYPFAVWEVRNQARMHYVNGFEPYTSTADGIAHWVETATCVAVRLDEGRLDYLFCHETDDLFNLTARPIQEFKTDALLPTFYDRIDKKGWRARWPDLKIEVD